ncbi:MAG: metal ABC transporter ATP-binding protein, partial [Pirellula sp.]
MNTEPAIEISDLTVAYERKPVLWEINLSVAQGVLGGIVGPNGAGKSTLIKAMLELVPRVSGTVKVLGQQIAAQRHRIAYVPQRESVDWDFPSTVLDVVLMGLYREIGWFRTTRKSHRLKALEALERVGIAELKDRQISQLSGGQQQ